MEYYAEERKKGTPTLCDNMDGTGEHYAKWNKPGGKRHVLNDLTYKWNLINKTNKGAEENQRHWDYEESDIDQSRSGRG